MRTLRTRTQRLTCAVAGCDHETEIRTDSGSRRELCAMHRRRFYRHGGVGQPGRLVAKPGGRCCICNCGGPARALGLCELHYRRYQRQGDPGRVLAASYPAPVRRAAVAMLAAGASVSDVARATGASLCTIYRWRAGRWAAPR